MKHQDFLGPTLAAAALLAASAAGAHEMEGIAQACSGKEVTVRLSADTGEGSAERETQRAKAGRSKDDQVADHLLRGDAEIKRDGQGSTLGWKRPSGERGAADCRKRLAAIAKRFPGRVSFMDPAKGGMKEVARQAVAPIPTEMQKTPSDAGLASRIFDSARDVKGGAVAGAVSSVPLPRRAPDSRPRSSMPPSFNRPYGAPPAPGSPLIDTAVSAFNGQGTHKKVAGMTIDTDGDLSNADPKLAALARRDPYRQTQTSVRYRNGKSLDPTRVPYVVIPIGYTAAKNGEMVVVQYGGRSVLAVVGDRGPKNRFGEGSMALAVALGISPSGTSGGVESGVTYTFLGTGVGSSASEAEMLSALKDRSLALQAAGLIAKN
ncbi:MAG: chitosanase [Elusimicrobia bacterium]|nr:MAG: chitosanase [Elusimicrobiota bacterium]